MTQPQVIHVPRSRQAIKQQSASLIATLLVLVGVAVALLPLGPSNAPLGQQFVTGAMRLAFKTAVPAQRGSHVSRPSTLAFPGPRLAAAAPVQSAAAPSCSSSGDTCSLGGGASSFAGSLAPSGQATKRRATPLAAAPESAVKTTGAVDKHWWNREKDVWVEVHTEEDFRREVSETYALRWLFGHSTRSKSVYHTISAAAINKSQVRDGRLAARQAVSMLPRIASRNWVREPAAQLPVPVPPKLIPSLRAAVFVVQVSTGSKLVAVDFFATWWAAG